jgi:hypothetical protein
MKANLPAMIRVNDYHDFPFMKIEARKPRPALWAGCPYGARLVLGDEQSHSVIYTLSCAELLRLKWISPRISCFL